MSNKIICNCSNINIGEKITLAKKQISAIEKWKIRFGETFTFIDVNGNCFRGRLQKSGGEIYIIVIEKFAGPVESQLNIILCQAIPEKERMEMIIEKAIELGVKKIIPFRSDKSITLEDREKKQKKAHKWPDVVLKASKQCRRSELAEIGEYTDFNFLMEKLNKIEGKILMSNYNYSCKLKEALKFVKGCREICLIIGPEGGFSIKELALAAKKGFFIAKSGERIMRTETAAIAALSAIQYELGDFN